MWFAVHSEQVVADFKGGHTSLPTENEYWVEPSEIEVRRSTGAACSYTRLYIETALAQLAARAGMGECTETTGKLLQNSPNDIVGHRRTHRCV